LLFIFFAKFLYKHGYTQIYQVAKNQNDFVKFEAFIILQSLKTIPNFPITADLKIKSDRFLALVLSQ